MADKIVAVPGVGNVAFPDSMSDDDIAAQIKKTSSPQQQPAYTQPKGTAGDRATQGFLSTTLGGLGSLAKAGGDALLQAVPGVAMLYPPTMDRPAEQMMKNIVLSHIDQAKKAHESLMKGDLSEAFGHTLATLIPGLGPAAAHAGERIGGTQPTFDNHGNVVTPGQAPDIAGGVGEGLGLVTSTVAPAAIKAGVGKVKAAMVDPVLDASAQSLTKRALKGGYTVTTPAEDVASAAKTMREAQIPLTPEGQAKIQAALVDLRKTVNDKVADAAQNGVTVDPRRVMTRLDETRNRFAQQVNPAQDLRDIEKVGKNFMADNSATIPAKPASTLVGPNGQPLSPATPAQLQAIPIPADQAQAMKVGSNTLNAEKYGKISTAQVEAEKALTRGIKEELENQIPELKGLNAEQARLMNLDEILGKAVNKHVNSAGFTTDLKTTNISAALLRSVIANPAVKARLAIFIDRVRGASPGPYRVSTSGLSTVNRLQDALTPPAVAGAAQSGQSSQTELAPAGPGR